MKLFEVQGGDFNPFLREFWATRTPDQLSYYFVQDNCYGASQDLAEFLETKGITNTDIIPIGRVVGGKKKQGWFRADVPDTSLDAFTKEEIAQAKSQGLDPRKKADRVAFIKNNKLEEEFMWIPHSWVEVRGSILDPSGFYVDGRSGQFDRLVTSKANLTDRYRYF